MSNNLSSRIIEKFRKQSSKQASSTKNQQNIIFEMDHTYNNQGYIEQDSAIGSSFAQLREEAKSPTHCNNIENPFAQAAYQSQPVSQRKSSNNLNGTNAQTIFNESTLTASVFSGRNLMKTFHSRHKSLNRSDFSNQPVFGLNLNNNLEKSQRGAIPKNSIFESSLTRGQLFKFGEANIQNLISSRKSRDSKVNSSRNSSRYNSQRISKDPVCRICLEKLTSDLMKPEALILPDSTICAPCKCAGSIKYIHKDCLKKWIQQRKSIECELCHAVYTQDWVKWANENNLRYNPNDPTQFEIQVMEFNRKYRLSKIGIFLAFILMALCITIECFQSYISVNIGFLRLLLLLSLIGLIIILVFWRHFLIKMTDDLVKDQVQINMSILPIDSAALMLEIENYRGGSVSNPLINDLIEKRMQWKSQPTVTNTSLQTYNQVAATSVYSLQTNPRQPSNSNQNYTAETFGDVNKLTLITSEEVHDIFADEDVPKFHQFRDEDEESEANKSNHKRIIGAAGVIPPVRKNFVIGNEKKFNL